MMLLQQYEWYSVVRLLFLMLHFYKKVDAGEIALTKENFLNKALEIDKLFGSQFQPSR